jgi:hypothetical protein
MRLTQDQIATVVQRELQLAQGHDSDQLATKRQKALQYYHGELPVASAKAGRSGIVSTDVADALHSLLAQVCPIVKTSLVEFEPTGEQDEPQAQMESDFVRKVIERADGYRVIFDAVHDAGLIGNGWLKVSVREQDKVTTENYPDGMAPEQWYVVMQPKAPDQKVERDGNKVTRTTRTRELRFECIPPENIVFSEGIGLSDLDSLRFIGECKALTVSQLRKMGASQEVIDQIPNYSTAARSQAQVARQGMYSNQATGEAVQAAEQLKLVWCTYIRLALDDGDKSELQHVWIGGDKVLLQEPAEWVPYITGSPIPMPHRVQGRGFYELLASVQDGKTEVLRSFIDNLGVMNASRVGAVEGQVNLDDLTNGRINGVVRMRSPDAIVPLPAADIGPQAMAGLGYMDRVRAARAGSSLDLNELQGQIMKSSATAAAGKLAEVEQMAGWYASNLVETILKPAYAMVHRLMRTELAGPVGAKIRGQWQQTDSSQWPERVNLSVLMGLTTTEKMSRVNSLSQVLMQQAQIMQMGGSGILVDNGKLYNAMTDWCRASDLQNPDQYLVDPGSDQAQQAEQSKAQQADQAKQEAQQAVQKGYEFELEKQHRDIEYKMWSDQLQADLDEAKITADALVKKHQATAQLAAKAPEKADTDD